jgi:hypothetical protein
LQGAPPTKALLRLSQYKTFPSSLAVSSESPLEILDGFTLARVTHCLNFFYIFFYTFSHDGQGIIMLYKKAYADESIYL